MTSDYRETLHFIHSWIFKADLTNLPFQGVKVLPAAVRGLTLQPGCCWMFPQEPLPWSWCICCLRALRWCLHMRDTSPCPSVVGCSALLLQQKAFCSKGKVDLCLLHMSDTLSLTWGCSHSYQPNNEHLHLLLWIMKVCTTRCICLHPAVFLGHFPSFPST